MKRYWPGVENVLWIDARSANDYEAEHVPGAILLNLEGWDELFPQFLDQWDPEKKVVVYCSSAGCELSHEVAERLKSADISQVFVLKGGWEAWKKQKVIGRPAKGWMAGGQENRPAC